MFKSIGSWIGGNKSQPVQAVQPQIQVRHVPGYEYVNDLIDTQAISMNRNKIRKVEDRNFEAVSHMPLEIVDNYILPPQLRSFEEIKDSFEEVEDDDFFNWYQGKHSTLIPMQYQPKYLSLLRYISVFMKNTVRTPKCKRDHQLQENPTLENILCHFSYAFFPDQRQKQRKKELTSPDHLIGNGMFGRIFQNKVSDQDIIIKVPIVVAEDTTIELFMNMVIINVILMTPELVNLSDHLVPSFGIYVCETNLPTDGSPLTENERLLSCPSWYHHPGNRTPTLFLIQKLLKNDDGTTCPTLSYLIKHNQVTFKDLMEYFAQIFNVLTLLQNSVLHISHNDLHPGNILIQNHSKGNPGSAYIIDWGKASFTLNGQYYGSHFFENNLSRKEVISGAFDLLQFARVGLFDVEDANTENKQNEQMGLDVTYSIKETKKIEIFFTHIETIIQNEFNFRMDRFNKMLSFVVFNQLKSTNDMTEQNRLIDLLNTYTYQDILKRFIKQDPSPDYNYLSILNEVIRPERIGEGRFNRFNRFRGKQSKRNKKSKRMKRMKRSLKKC